MVLDELDEKILRKLRENAIKPFVKIAQELGVTEGTIRQRVKRLSAGGVIKKFTVHVDAGSVGLPVVAFLNLNVTPGRIPEAASELAKIDGVVEVHQTHADGDLLVKVRARDLDGLGETVANKLRTIDCVQVSSVSPVLKIWKDAPA